MGYSKLVIAELLNTICITKIVAHYIKCWERKKNVNEYIALCPFHYEKTPSLTITKIKQFYHCFGCGAHGNAIEFVMEYRGLGFLDAVKEVACIGKFHLPKGSKPSKKKIKERKRYRSKK